MDGSRPCLQTWLLSMRLGWGWWYRRLVAPRRLKQARWHFGLRETPSRLHRPKWKQNNPLPESTGCHIVPREQRWAKAGTWCRLPRAFTSCGERRRLLEWDLRRASGKEHARGSPCATSWSEALLAPLCDSRWRSSPAVAWADTKGAWAWSSLRVPMRPGPAQRRARTCWRAMTASALRPLGPPAPLARELLEAAASAEGRASERAGGELLHGTNSFAGRPDSCRRLCQWNGRSPWRRWCVTKGWNPADSARKPLLRWSPPGFACWAGSLLQRWGRRVPRKLPRGARASRWSAHSSLWPRRSETSPAVLADGADLSPWLARVRSPTLACCRSASSLWMRPPPPAAMALAWAVGERAVAHLAALCRPCLMSLTRWKR